MLKARKGSPEKKSVSPRWIRRQLRAYGTVVDLHSRGIEADQLQPLFRCRQGLARRGHFSIGLQVKTQLAESLRILRLADGVPLQHEERALPISTALSQRTDSTTVALFKLKLEVKSSSRAALCGAIDRNGVCNPYAEDRCWANGWNCVGLVNEAAACARDDGCTHTTLKVPRSE